MEHGEKGSRKAELKPKGVGTTVAIEEKGETAVVTCGHGTVAPNPSSWSKSWGIARRSREWCAQCRAAFDAPVVDTKTDEEKAAWRASMEEHKAAADRTAAERKLAEINAELEKLPSQIEKARTEYDRAFAAACALPDNASAEKVRDAWSVADTAMNRLVGLTERKRGLERRAERMQVPA